MTSLEMLNVFFPAPQGDKLEADMLKRKFLKKKKLKMRECVFALCRLRVKEKKSRV